MVPGPTQQLDHIVRGSTISSTLDLAGKPDERDEIANRAAIVFTSMVRLQDMLMHYLHDSQGAWSIGVFKGSSPMALQPLELLRPRADVPGAWPVANPVLTCASVTGNGPSLASQQLYGCQYIFRGLPEQVVASMTM